MLNNSSRSLLFGENRLKKTFRLFSLSIGSETFRFVGKRDEHQVPGHAYMYLYVTRSVYKHIDVLCIEIQKEKSTTDASERRRGRAEKNLANQMYPKISFQEPPASMCRIPEIKRETGGKKIKNKIPKKNTHT